MANHEPYLDIYGWSQTRWRKAMNQLTVAHLASLHPVLVADLKNVAGFFWNLDVGVRCGTTFVHSHDSMMDVLKDVCTEFDLDRALVSRYLPAYMEIEVRPFFTGATITNNRHQLNQDLSQPEAATHLTLFDSTQGFTQGLAPWHAASLRTFHCDWCLTPTAKIGLNNIIHAPEPTYLQVAEAAISPHLMNNHKVDCTCCQTARARRVQRLEEQEAEHDIPEML